MTLLVSNPKLRTTAGERHTCAALRTVDSDQRAPSTAACAAQVNTQTVTAQSRCGASKPPRNWRIQSVGPRSLTSCSHHWQHYRPPVPLPWRLHPRMTGPRHGGSSCACALGAAGSDLAHSQLLWRCQTLHCLCRRDGWAWPQVARPRVAGLTCRPRHLLCQHHHQAQDVCPGLAVALCQ